MAGLYSDRVPTAPEPVSADGPELDGPRPLRQQWRDVAFLHWAVDPSAVSPLLPPGVHPDLHDGRTYLGLVAFRMVDVGFARGPALPAFPETNVRLYSVDDAGRRGVVFVSLDADQPILAAAGRIAVRVALPLDPDGAAPVRLGPDLPRPPPRDRRRSRLVVRAGDAMVGGPLEHFLTARWGLHVRHLGRTWFLPNTHQRWPLHEAELIALGRPVDRPASADRAGRPGPGPRRVQPGCAGSVRPPAAQRSASTRSTTERAQPQLSVIPAPPCP